MTLNFNLLLCPQIMHVVTKQMRLESRGFRYKVALYSDICILSLTTKLKEIYSNFKHKFRLACIQSWFGSISSQISQLLTLVTLMYNNERTCDKWKCGLRNVNLQIRRMFTGAADWRWIFALRSYFFLLYFHYLWLSTWYNIDESKAREIGPKILYSVTLKQGKTHCERWLIMDPLAHVVMDMDADLE